jgi:hypothetical protein
MASAAIAGGGWYDSGASLGKGAGVEEDAAVDGGWLPPACAWTVTPSSDNCAAKSKPTAIHELDRNRSLSELRSGNFIESRAVWPTLRAQCKQSSKIHGAARGRSAPRA